MDFVSQDEEGTSFLTQTLMNLGDTNSDDVIVRDEFYALDDLQKFQSIESAETELEFREDLWYCDRQLCNHRNKKKLILQHVF